MFVLSRKALISVERNVEALLAGQFAEPTVKALLTDLRELARAAPTIGLDDPQFSGLFREFVEICDFLAHANRTKGLFEIKIREKAEEIAQAFDSADESRLKSAMIFEPLISLDRVVAGMLSTSLLFLLQRNSGLPSDFLNPAFERRDEIGLCILSLLQDSIIRLKRENGVALLHILSYEGRYRLYCAILGSKVEADARKRTGGTGSLVLGFPVIDTSIQNIDGVLADRKSADGLEIGSSEMPPLIETFREASGRLAVREVQ